MWLVTPPIAPCVRSCYKRSKNAWIRRLYPTGIGNFVRNRLIDEVYLPLIGDNFAKQIGSVGANKRTDLQGLLLLIRHLVMAKPP